jgi:hypothetical protein
LAVIGLDRVVRVLLDVVPRRGNQVAWCCDHKRSLGSLGGLGGRMAPAVLPLTADACAFAALGGEDVGVAGVGVAPAQVLVHVAAQGDMVLVVGPGDHEGA